ncbi:MAG: hypothetical protein K2O88_09885 [Paramuribaculum sp.]|nr:hypothetical protein [Paramuribaculum sp.]
MKNLRIFGLTLLAVLATSCKDDFEEPRQYASEGDDVQFGIDLGAQSRTMYGTITGGSQMIYWGSYTGEVDKDIMVYSPEALAGRRVGTYHVTAQDDNFVDGENGEKVLVGTPSNVGATVVKTSEVGVQWGTDGVPHNFYAFYPMSEVRTQGYNGGSDVVTVNLRPGQTPVSYGVLAPKNPANGSALPEYTPNVDNSLVTVLQTGKEAARTIIGNPRMDAALMWAKNEGVEFGSEKVGLKFEVIADVLEVTINGPLKDNELLINAPEGEKAAGSIEIQEIYVEAYENPMSETKVPINIAGEFDFNIKTGKVVSVGANGTNRVAMQPSIVDNSKKTHHPILYTREDGYDQLKVRFFLIPGQVKDASQLNIRVVTEYGVYDLNENNYTLSSSDKLSGTGYETGSEPTKIHRILLPHFMFPGTSFKIDGWMSQIDPNVYLSELSIPGAWHCISPYYQDCRRFAAQYQLGIRAFEFQVIMGTKDGKRVPFIVGGYKNKSQQASTFTVEEAIQVLGRLVNKSNRGVVFLVLGAVEDNEKAAGVSALLEKYRKPVNNEEYSYIYDGVITSETTLGDVACHIVPIIYSQSSTSSQWAANSPALFVRWTQLNVDGVTKVATSPMRWGAPIEQGDASDMKWLYLDHTNTENYHYNGQDNLPALKLLVDDFVTLSRQNFIEGNHNSLYQMSIGGANSADPNSTNCNSVAQEMNPYMLGLLSGSTREPAPTGLVMMNKVSGTWGKGYNRTDDDGNEIKNAPDVPYPIEYNDAMNAYSSADLIKAIIYNNNAFAMRKRPKN